ncbi:MAG: hypothetical protein R2867_46740 [Caldilineaceae bacterium]
MPDARDRDGGRYRSPDIRQRAPLVRTTHRRHFQQSPDSSPILPICQPATRPLTGIAFTVAQ